MVRRPLPTALLTLLLLWSVVPKAATESAHTFEQFSAHFVEAIRASDASKLSSLLPEGAKHNEPRYALDDTYFTEFRSSARSLRSILGERGFHAMEILITDSRQEANLFLISRDSGVSESLPLLPQLEGKRLMVDYAVCPLQKIDGRVTFRGSFCLSEEEL